MDISVKINKISTTGSVKATASVTIGECFGVRGVKVMEGKNGLFINMPSYKSANGQYNDICYPVTADFRREMNDAVIKAYKLAIDKLQSQSVNIAQAEQNPEQIPEQYSEQIPDPAPVMSI